MPVHALVWHQRQRRCGLNSRQLRFDPAARINASTAIDPRRSPPILPGRPFARGFSACLAALIGPPARACGNRLKSPAAAQPWRLQGRFAENAAKR